MNDKVDLRLLHKVYLLVTVSMAPLILSQMVILMFLQRTHGNFGLIILCYASIIYSLFVGYSGAYFFANNTLRRLLIVRMNLDNITNGNPLIRVEKDFFSDELTSLLTAVHDLGSKLLSGEPRGQRSTNYPTSDNTSENALIKSLDTFPADFMNDRAQPLVQQEREELL